MGDVDLLLVAKICRLKGQKLVSVYRTYYEHQGTINRDEGELTLVFENDEIVRFTEMSDGWDTQIRDTRYDDPFREPLSEDNREWVAAHGKWTEVCANDEPEWRIMLGKSLVAVGRVFYRSFQAECGFALHYEGGHSVYVWNVSDQIMVNWQLDERCYVGPLC